MQRTRGQMGEALAGVMCAKMEELLDWCEGTPEPTLEQIEEKVLAWREALGAATTELIVGNQEARAPAVVRCPRCGQEAVHKGLRTVHVESRVGALKIERVYYSCPRCRAGFFPPG